MTASGAVISARHPPDNTLHGFAVGIAQTPVSTALSRLELSRFRNYRQLSLHLDPSCCVILTGHNGAGKTNILEAISFLSPGRGLRRARLVDADWRGGEDHPSPAAAWAVYAELSGSGGGVESLATGRDAAAADESEKRLVKIDGKTVRGQGELTRALSLVWLTPQMDTLFLDGASARRRFFDRLVYGFDTEHAARIAAYEQVMRERNRLLAMPRADAAWIASLERKMAEYATGIAQARLVTLERLQHAISASSCSFPKARLALRGMAEDMLLHGQACVEVEQALCAALEAARGRDAALGRATLGAHKTELIVFHEINGFEAAGCSTGEQKALLLGMVLAQTRALATWSGRTPVVLLDEVIAHLDDARRLELCEEICETRAQVWMTGTDPDLFRAMKGRACFFTVDGATVTAS